MTGTDSVGAGAGRSRSWRSGSARSPRRSSRASGANRRRTSMVAERQENGWRRWRDVGLVVCTAWLVVQNLAVATVMALALAAWLVHAPAPRGRASQEVSDER